MRKKKKLMKKAKIVTVIVLVTAIVMLIVNITPHIKADRKLNINHHKIKKLKER